MELLITATIGLFLVAAGGKLYVTAKLNAKIQNEIEGIQQNARFGMSLIVNDIRRAGYLGGLQANRPIAGSEKSLPADGSCDGDDNSWGRMLEQPLFALNDTSQAYECIPSKAYARGDVLTLRYVDSQPAIHFDAERLYLRSSPVEGRLFTGQHKAADANRLEGDVFGARRVYAHVYYIRPSTTIVCPDGSRPPSLYRETLDSKGRPRAEEIAAGIENLQLLFGGREQASTMLHFENADKVNHWESVEQVRVWLLARQVCPTPEPIEGQRQFQMADTTYNPENRNYRRELFVRTVQLRNR